MHSRKNSSKLVVPALFVHRILVPSLVLAVGLANPVLGTEKIESVSSDKGTDPWVWKDIDGEAFQVRRSKEAKFTVVVFVSTDCPVANAFQPALRDIQSKYKDKHVQFFQVHPTARTTTEKAKKHKKEFRIEAPVVLDPELKIARLLKAKVTPEAFLIDESGKVLYRGRINDLYVGFGKKRRKPRTHDLSDAIENAIAGEPIAVTETKAIGCLIPQK